MSHRTSFFIIGTTLITFAVGDDYQEVKLNSAAISVTDTNGPLLADIRTLGGEGGLSARELGSVVGALAGVAGVEGATEASLLLNTLGGGRRTSSERPIRLYTLNDGKGLLVRITRPFRLSLPVKDSEPLDFSQLGSTLTAEIPPDGFDFDY